MLTRNIQEHEEFEENFEMLLGNLIDGLKLKFKKKTKING